jgi:hypothetical protein
MNDSGGHLEQESVFLVNSQVVESVGNRLQKHESLQQNHEHAVPFEVTEHLVTIEDNKSNKLTNLDYVVPIFEVLKALSFELDALEHDEEDLGQETHSVAHEQERKALH